MTQIDTSTEAVEALLKDVTQGPWERNPSNPKNVVPVAGLCLAHFSKGTNERHAEANSQFLLVAPLLVPALLAERDALEAEVERLKAQADTVWNEAIEAAVKLVNSMANDALTVAAREHAFQIAEAIGELKGESHE